MVYEVEVTGKGEEEDVHGVVGIVLGRSILGG